MPNQTGAASTAALQSPGREADARVARITYRLTVAGRKRCPVVESSLGLLFQHLSQFDLADRPGMIATQALDRGPGVIAVVPGGPGDVAGVRANDVLLTVNGVTLPSEPGLADPFDAARAHARADSVHDLLARAGMKPMTLTVLRDGAVVPVEIRPAPTCPSQVHLARSGQRNAFADGRHVFVTTGLLARLGGDDQIAFVIAHELAHNILRHAAILRSDKVRHGRIVRQTERDADALAGELMLDAGFDPVAGAQALLRLAADGGGTNLSGHGSDADRVEAMRALAVARGGR